MIYIASMVGTPDLETPTLAPYCGDLFTAFQKLSALGYEGVELMIKQPGRLDGDHIRMLLAQNHLHLVGICTGHIFGEDHLGLVTSQLVINPLALERLKEVVDFAAVYFGMGTLVNIGRSRGVGDSGRKAATLDCAKEAIQDLADYAVPKGIRLILEPISKNEVNFIHSTQDGLSLVGLVNRPNFGLMLDTYHMYREDADPLRSLYEAMPHIWHIHLSDSNRCYPNSATTPFQKVIETLGKIKYEGFVGMEIKPWPDPDYAARESIHFLRRYIPVPV